MSGKSRDTRIIKECQKMLEDGLYLDDILYYLSSSMVALYVMANEDNPIDHEIMAGELGHILFHTIQVHKENAE